MQPDPTTRLRGIRRVLDELVAPAVDDGYVKAQLVAVSQMLEDLAGRWHRWPVWLAEENEALVSLFADAVAASELALNAPLCARIESALREGSAADYEALAERNRALRMLLSETIRALAAAPPSSQRDALRTRVRALLRAGVDRISQP